MHALHTRLLLSLHSPPQSSEVYDVYDLGRNQDERENEDKNALWIF